MLPILRRGTTLENLAQKVKISVLWILLGFNLTLVFSLKDFDPGTAGLQHMLATLPSEQLPLLLLGDATIRVVPFVLAFLSLALKDALSRWMNVGLGFVFTVAALFGLVTLLTALTFATAYLLLAQFVAIAAAALIFWYAYKWKEALPTSARTQMRGET